MALLFATGFGLTTTVADLFDSSTGPPLIGSYGRNSGAGLDCNGGSINALKNLGVNASTCVVGFAVYIFGNPQNGAYLCSFYDAGTIQVGVTVDSDGTVHVTGATDTFNITFNTYHYFEIKVVFNSTVGAVTVRLDGEEVLAATGIDTQGSSHAYATQFDLTRNQSGFGKHFRFDDLVIMDGTDGTATQGAPFNDFLGDVRVDELLPSAAGDSTAWTPSAGSNYQCVDETTRNDDTDYVSSSTVGNKDLYTVADLSSSVGSIKAVMTTMRARKDDAGTRTIKSKVKHGGVEGDGADHGLTTTYVYLQDVFGVNPSTSAAWTIAEVNATQVGIEVVA